MRRTSQSSHVALVAAMAFLWASRGIHGFAGHVRQPSLVPAWRLGRRNRYRGSRALRFSTDDDDPPYLSFRDERARALESLLGYSPESAAEMSAAQVEDETLEWAVNNGIVSLSEVNDDGDRIIRSVPFYDTITDIVFSDSVTVLECLADVWQNVASVYDEAIAESQAMTMSNATNLCKQFDGKKVQFIVFPKSAELWDYDIMTTMLMAVEFSKEQLDDVDRGADSTDFNLELDLFHPNYKNAPKLWSPERHSPFPTVGLRIRTKTRQSYLKDPLTPFRSYDDAAQRRKLEQLFAAAAAIREELQGEQLPILPNSPEDILQSCQDWMQRRARGAAGGDCSIEFAENILGWKLNAEKQPYHLFKDVWSLISQLSQGQSAIVVSTKYGAHDARRFQRFAVKVNAALKRITDGRIKLEMFHPEFVGIQGKSEPRRSPYPILQFTHK